MQTEAQVSAFTKVTNAQGEQEAATKQAEARLQLAQADAQSRELVARGEKAQQLVPVEIARENVSVEQARVDVERNQLANRQEFAEAGIRLEIEKLRIQADKEVQQEFARALASFLSHGNMTLYGTPETAQKMMDNMAKGFGVRAMAEGFLSGSNGNGTGSGHSPIGTNGTGQPNDHVDALLGNLGKLVGPAIEKLTGQSVTTTEQADAIARALAANPQALQAIADALAGEVKAAATPAASLSPVVVATPVAEKKR